MISVLSTNITSPLGFTTEQNYQALRNGCSALSRYERWRGVPEVFAASLFSEQQLQELLIEGYSRFESIVIRSISQALSKTSIDYKSKRNIFILSTTKANVEELSSSIQSDGSYLAPGATAQKIARYFGFTTPPVVVCNACISGVTAQALAHRLIRAGHYDTAIVCGADCQMPFIVSGFLAFKSLSAEECRPFDIERLGLNLGEAASTIIFAKEQSVESPIPKWRLLAEHLNNDAHHISAPSPIGEGAYQTIKSCLRDYDVDDLAEVSVHGTATMFNDQMESKAIERAELSAIPLSALKGYYGHTLGAAGVLESVVTMRALEDGVILPTRGYGERGVSGKVNISAEEQLTDKRSFLKIISGFGGCNGALLFSKQPPHPKAEFAPCAIQTLHRVQLTPDSVKVDGRTLPSSASGRELLSELYKRYVGDYPKFYKMDLFSRVAFVAVELLLQQQEGEQRVENHKIILFNRSSSIVADRAHLSTIEDENNFYPSPSLFLYTLPNIVTGEIAIKHSYTDETTLYILAERDEDLINQIISSTYLQPSCKQMITGWVDCSDEENFEADIKVLTI